MSIIGATESMLAISIPISAMKKVMTRALIGSPLLLSFLKGSVNSCLVKEET